MARLDRAARRHGVPVHDRPEGLPAERGPGPVQRQHRGGAGHRLRRHGRGTSSEVADIVAKDPNVAGFSSNVGGGPRRRRRSTRGRVSVDLKPRDPSGSCRSIEVIAELRPKLAQVPGHPRRTWSTSRRSTSAASRARAASISSRCRTPTPAELYQLRADARGEDARAAGHRGRQQRPAAQEPADPGRRWIATRSRRSA